MLRRLFGGRSPEPYRRGMALYNAGQLEEALQAFEEVLGSGRDSSHPETSLAGFYHAEAHARLGALRLEEGRASEALVHFDAALEHSPGYPDRHLRRGVALLELDDPLAAEQAARRALEGNEHFVEAGALVVLSLLARGDAGRARTEREQWSRVASERGHALADFLRGPAPTVQGLREHLVGQQRRRERIARAEGLLNQGFWTEARNSLEALVAEAPGYPDIRVKLATALVVLGDTTSATLHLDAALSTNPEFVDARLLAATVDLVRGDSREARRHLARARDAIGDRPAIRYGELLTDVFEGEYPRAIDRLLALQREAELPEAAQTLLACLHAIEGQVEACLAALDGVDWKHAGADRVLDGIACALRCGELERGQRLVSRLPAGAPMAAVAVARSEVLLQEGNVVGAMDVLEAATATHPSSPALLWALARLHARRGEADLGLRRLANLDALDARVPGAHALSARLLRMRGDLDAALGALGEGDAPSTDAEHALERLYTERAAGRVDDARRLVERWMEVAPLSLAWRVQEASRWTAPLLPEPVSPSEATSAGGNHAPSRA